jgi:LCP family protein required for cell wall assembly
MANGRPPDDGSRFSPRSPRSNRGGNSGGLEALGKQIGGGAPPPSGRAANAEGLKALGARIEGTKGRGRTRRNGKPRHTAGQRALRIAVGFLALLIVLAAAGYGYFRYEFGQINTAKCPSCTQVASGAPYNVLIIGSDTRAGETAAEAKEFGDAAEAGGQRSDSIKIIHVDPQTGTARVLSIPRDTFVKLSGVPVSSGVSTLNKINAAFATGPNDKNPSGTGANGVVKTIENTFGIPITHWIVVNFFGLTDAVTSLGGVSMDVPVPIRDYGPCGPGGSFTNCSGLNISTTGCQSLTGPEALSLSRSRDFEYYENGYWHSDGTGDIGRIERQDLLIESVINKAKSTYNPIKAAGFISSMTHDVTLDDQLSATALLSLAERYHAFSGSSLGTFTLPTTGGSYAPYGNESVEIVQEPQAAEMIQQFLGAAPNAAVTPPLDEEGAPESTAVPVTTPVTTPGSGTGSTAHTTTPKAATASIPSFDPRPC